MPRRRAALIVALAVALALMCGVEVHAISSNGETYANSAMYRNDANVTTVDLRAGLACFSERRQRPRVPEFFLRSTIPLEVIYTWVSQRMMTIAFGILLEEKLGYDVRYKAWDLDTGQALLGSHTVTARAYENVLYGKSAFNLELWPLSGKAGRSNAVKTSLGKTSDFSLVDSGLGQVARNGWYVEAQSVADPYTWHTLSLLNASGAFNISSTTTRLLLSLELPVNDLRNSSKTVDTSLCAPNATTLSWYGGTLDCVTGSWAPSNPTCCTRYLNRTSACAVGMEPCFAFVQDSPAWLRSEHERRVTSSGLPLEIVYANALQTVAWATNRTANGTPSPFLFYWWEPNVNVIAQKYIRIAMQDTLYCSQPYMDVDGITMTPPRQSNSYRFGNFSTPTSCDFEREVLEKGAHEPGRSQLGDAFYLFESLQFSFDDIQALLLLREEYGANYSVQAEQEFLAACAWLKANEDNWLPYIRPQSFIFATLPYVVAAFFLGCAYVTIQQRLLFARGGYHDTETRRSREVKSAMLKSPILMLDHMEQKNGCSVDVVNADSQLFVPDNAPELSFRLRELHVGDDECAVTITICRSSPSAKRACCAELYVHSETCKLGVDYQVPSKLGDGPGKLERSEEMPGSERLRLEFEHGQVDMQIQLPIISNPCWSPRRSLFVCMAPVLDDASAQIAPIDHLAVIVHQMTLFPRTSTQLSHTTASGFSNIVRFMVAFLREMIYVPWIIPMIWRYQLVYFIMAGLDTYVWSTAFALLLNVGFIEQRGDYCTFIAMIYLAIELFRYHIGLHYFPGSYVIQTHLECLVGQKYLSLSVADLAAIGNAESLFRVSATTDTHSIRVDFWRRIHDAFIEFYRLLGALLFICVAFKDQSDYFIVGQALYIVGILCGAIVFIRLRIRGCFLAGADEDELEVMMCDATYYLYRHNDIVRESKTESKTSSRHHEKLWLLLNGGLFERWYQDYFNKWNMTMVLVCTISLAYGLAPLAIRSEGISVGLYVSLIGSIAQLGSAVISITDGIAVMLATVAKIAQMSDLLNLQSTRCRHINAMHKQYKHKDNHDEGFERHHERITLSSLTSTTEGDAAIYIDSLTVILNHPDDRNVKKPRTLLNSLSMVDQFGAAVKTVPAGGFIGIRETRGTFSTTLMNVFAGTDIPYTGMACINPLFISRMASTNTSMLIGQTFEDNLTLGLTLERSRLPPTCARAQRIAVLQSRYDSEMLYRLCKALEVTDSILGQEYFEGWADMSASSVTSILDPITRFKMALVQCVLAEPDVILINGFGDHLTHENLQKMGEFLRLWLDRKFPIIDDDFCGDVRVHRPRTIIWHGTPLVLVSVLEPHEPVINIVAKSEATISPAHIAFDGVDASDFVDVMERIRPQQDIVNPIWRSTQGISMRSQSLKQSMRKNVSDKKKKRAKQKGVDVWKKKVLVVAQLVRPHKKRPSDSDADKRIV